MYRLLTAIMLTALVGVVIGLRSNPAPDAPTGPVLQDAHSFEGVARCKTCHRKAEDGEQFAIWEASRHAQAFATLATDEAKAIAAEKGIENPQEADACLKCHVTGHGAAADMFGSKYAVEDGVGCESCHGAGGDYYKKKTMQAITDGEIDGASVGLIQPTAEVCEGCHNEESPTYKEFDFETMVEKIAHPIPEG